MQLKLVLEMFEKLILKNTIKRIHEEGSGQISTTKLLKQLNLSWKFDFLEREKNSEAPLKKLENTLSWSFFQWYLEIEKWTNKTIFGNVWKTVSWKHNKKHSQGGVCTNLNVWCFIFDSNSNFSVVMWLRFAFYCVFKKEFFKHFQK